MAAKVVSNIEREFLAGRKMFRDGKPRPPYPANENTPEEWRWAGWGVEYGLQILERQRVKRLLGVED